MKKFFQYTQSDDAFNALVDNNLELARQAYSGNKAADYSDKNSIAAAAMFYQYLSEKEEKFLIEHDFSREEVLDGISRLMRQAGYADVIDIVEGTVIGIDTYSEYNKI